MEMVRKEKKNLYRQVHEGVLIDCFKGKTLLNQKGKWGSNLPARLEVERGDGRPMRSQEEPNQTSTSSSSTDAHDT